MKKKKFPKLNRYIEIQDRREWKGIDPQFLTKNNMWDSSWLMEKYPERFNHEYL